MTSVDIAYRYAKALSMFSENNEEAKERAHLLTSFSEVLKGKENLMSFFSSPQVNIPDKIKILDQIFKDSNDLTLKRFFLLLIEKRRFSLIPEIAEHYKNLIDERAGIATGVLTTYSPLSDKTLSKLKVALEKQLHKKIDLVEKTDPHLLGGGILSINNKLLDFSLSGKLSRLKNHLTAKRF